MVPVVFSLFIDDLDSGISCDLSKFAEDTRWAGEVNAPAGCAAIQRNFSRLNKMAIHKLGRPSSMKKNAKSSLW